MDSRIIRQRVKSLRHWMAEEGYDAFIIPTIDPHNSEYTPIHWACREWLTSFTGSAGTAVVTQGAAALWTDSRYFLQAEEQLDGTPFSLMREGEAATPTVAAWIARQVVDSGSVGYYGEMMTPALRDELLQGLPPYLEERCCIDDPFTFLWQDRPVLPATPLRRLDDAQTGWRAADKLRTLYQRQKALAPEMTYFLLNDLSEIAWTLNLRGDDIPYTPLFVSYLAIGEHHAVLFLDEHRLTDDIRRYLASLGVTTRRYEAWRPFIESLTADDALVFADTMNVAVVACCRDNEVQHHCLPSCVPLLRAVKTAEEQAGFREAMVRDGVAMVQFLRRLPQAVAAGIDEVGVDTLLTEQRRHQEGFLGLSFATIAGYGPHGAIVHYEAESDSAAPLRPEGLLLLDSGAHYDCGTTDITRTLALGAVGDEERRVYTLVLKGHIALSRCRFPEGATGLQLDGAARYAMWQQGYDFGHGTGHGVGHGLCVHEGPQQIRKNVRACSLVPLQAGMTVTDEPGIYVAGHFGVRIENTLLVVDGGQTDYGHFLAFEPLTLCPIDRTPIDTTLLTDDELSWLNAYHRRVCDTLLPRLDDAADREWLIAATTPLTR